MQAGELVFNVTILFILIGLIFLVELSTSISRKAGYVIGNPSSGFIFQSSLALVSRALVFMFIPILGYLSDKNLLSESYLKILLLFGFIPYFWLLVMLMLIVFLFF